MRMTNAGPLSGFALWASLGLAVSIGLLPFSAGLAQSYLPSVKIGTASLISPSAADSYYANLTVHTDQLQTITGVATPTQPEIVELARALRNNPDLIYEYVRNNIEVVWMYGLQKGALGAAIDKSGTPFDQAALMVSLLRQGGYTANYKAGTIALDGAQFTSWTGISNATAACQMLSSGGIPAAVNGSTLADCSYGASATVTSVTLSHIWVEVTIGGSNYLFDPSYKPYAWKPGIDLAAATGLLNGTPLSQATTGMDSGAQSGANYVHNLNSEALNNQLQTYASNLLTYLQNHSLPDQPNRQTTPLAAGEMEDIVGGGTIMPIVSPAGGQRLTTLPYATVVQHSWAGDIPNQYRTSLIVSSTMENYNEPQDGYYTYDTAFSVSLYVDEIYGRRLVVDTDLPELQSFCNQTNGSGCSNTAYLKLDGQILATHTNPALASGGNWFSSRGAGATISLSVNHPYSASANGANATGGDYMDASLTKAVTLTTPLTIVHGWGDTSANLLKKWSDEIWRDKLAPTAPPVIGGDMEQIRSHLGPNQGDATRTKTAASWLAQYSRQAHLNAQIAGSVVQLHHTLGVVYADTNLNPAYATRTTTGQPIGDPNFTQIDSFDRVDIDAALSVTSKTADAVSRRAAVQAIAASSAALEGSISQQMADLPDTSSTATRFGWGNRPPSAEDPTTAGPRAFFQFDAANASAAQSVLMLEGQVNGTPCATPIPVSSAPCPNANYRTPVAEEIQEYAQSGFTVVGSQETFLGPGQRGGGLISNLGSSGYTFQPTKQRGGAFVATRYANGEPVEIAHIVSGLHTAGISVFTKGGGGGVGPNKDAAYNPSEAADILKSRFVDRSSEQGVNLSNGGVAFKSPVTLRVGNGGFPYELSATLEWNSAPPLNPVNVNVPTQPQPGLTHNWTNNLAVSSSGMEAMGASDVRTAVGTIAAFLATQDIYKSVQSPQRDVAAVLAQAWWAKQISGNAVTVSHGTSSRQFVKLPTGQWIAPGAGAHAALTQNGARVPYQELCDDPPGGYATSRGWDSSNVSFDVTNANGDIEHFAHWKNWYYSSTTSSCGLTQGFRLTTWTFPQGVSVYLDYGNRYNPKPGDGSNPDTGIDQLIRVRNSLGRVINIQTAQSNNGQIHGFDNGLTGTDLRTVSVNKDTSTGTITITNPGGKAWTVVSGSLPAQSRPFYPVLVGQIFSPLNTSIPFVQYVYDSLGRVKEVDDANRLQLGNRNPYYFYIADGTRGERVDPLGNSYTVVYDTKAKPRRFIDELGRETRAAFDGRGRVTSYVYPEQDCEQLGYDDHNNPTSFVRVDKLSGCNKDAGAAHTLIASATWDQTWNKPLTVTDIRGNTTTLTYYGSGTGASLVNTATRPNGGIYGFTYNTIGKPLRTTDPTGFVVSNGYNLSDGNLETTTVDPDHAIAATTSFAYDAQGDVFQTTDPRGNASTATYDLNRRQIFAIGPIPDAVHSRIAIKNTYDDEGRTTFVEKGSVSSAIGDGFLIKATTATSYDPVGNKIKVTTDKSVAQFSYDGVNRVDCAAIRMNRNVDGTFGTLPSDACSLSTATTYGPDRITKNFYDAAGQLRQIIRAYGLGQDFQQVYATYKYSPNGKQLAVADANAVAWDHIGLQYSDALNANAATANQTNYLYDAFDRPIRTTYADNTFEQVSYYDDVNQTHLCSGNGSPCTKTTRAGQAITLSYNDVDQLVLKVVPAVSGASPAIPGDTVSWELDSAGRPLSVSDTRGTTLTNHYDTMKRVDWTTTTVSGNTFDNSGSTISKTVTYSYDVASNRTRITWPETNYSIGYGYDNANKMAGVCENGDYIAANLACNAGALLTKYNFDELGRPAGQQNGNASSSTLSWSPDDELLTVAHDLSGTSSDVSYADSYTPAHQIGAANLSNPLFKYAPQAAASIAYTANGLNQYSAVGGQTIGYDANGNLTGDGTFTFQYDPENRLMSVKQSGTNVASYVYDPLGRRLAKTVGNTVTFFVSADDDEIAEYDGAGALLRRFVPGAGIDKPIAMVAAAGTRTFFHQDKLGSVIAMSDASSAMVEGPYTYDEYGNCKSGGQACSAGVPYRYTARRLDPETGLYYYRARYYSAKIGRFLQTDPIGYKDDINWYTYVGNDPTDNTDPSGLYYGPAAFCLVQPEICAAGVSETLNLLGVGALSTMGSRRADPYVVRVQAQGRRIGEHSRTLRAKSPIPASQVRQALFAVWEDLTRRQQRLLEPAFEDAQYTIRNAEQNGGVPQGYSMSHYVRGVPGTDARVDIESKAGNGNIGPGGRIGSIGLFSNESATIRTNADGSRTAVISSTGSRLTTERKLD